jgi:hypothetical protein
MELDAKRLGLAGGIVWGICVVFTVILALIFGIGADFVEMMASFYIGLEVSLLGIIIGFIYGFIDGFVGFFLIGWIYNKLG